MNILYVLFLPLKPKGNVLTRCVIIWIYTVKSSSPPLPPQGSSWASWVSASPSCSARPSAGCAVASERSRSTGRRWDAVSRKLALLPFISSPSMEACHGRTAKTRTEGLASAWSSTHHLDTATSSSVGLHLPTMRWRWDEMNPTP